jgi:hypothetical protein
VKNHYPVPIIEGLLDETIWGIGASWFSWLDLTAGYYQILQREGEVVRSTRLPFRLIPVIMSFGWWFLGCSGCQQPFRRSWTPHWLHCFISVCSWFFMTFAFTIGLMRSTCVIIKFPLLIQDHWLMKRSKCLFAQHQLKYLDHGFQRRVSLLILIRSTLFFNGLLQLLLKSSISSWV